MKKFFVFACAVIMCMSSCVNSDMREKRAVCKSLCDSLTASSVVKSLTVESCRATTWRISKHRMMMVGKTPVMQPYYKTVKGCVLVLENGQQCLTSDFLYIPPGSVITQKAIYTPEKFTDGDKCGYRPVITKYKNCVLSDGKMYEIDFDIL